MEIGSSLANDINIVIPFNCDMNQHQCGVNDSFIAIFTFIRPLSESAVLISAKSKLISLLIYVSNILQHEIAMVICTVRSRYKV